MIALPIAAAVAAGGVADFKAAFPSAAVVTSVDGTRLLHASGFEAAALGESAESAARAFLAKYRTAFGIGSGQRLVAHEAASSSFPRAVRFERRIAGLPVFDADMVVGVNAANAIVLVNAGDTPAAVSGRARISRDRAVAVAKAAMPARRTSGVASVERGWHAAGRTLRPVWRVDLVATDPTGDVRTYVDAATGKVLSRVDLRTTGAIAPAPGGDGGLLPR